MREKQKPKTRPKWLIFSAILGVAIAITFLPGIFRSKRLFEKTPLLGKEPPNFEAIDTGEIQSLQDPLTDKKPLKEITSENRIVIINFFASWCTECKEERIKLSELKKYENKNKKEVKVVGVVFQDSKEKILEYLKEINPYDYIYFDKGETSIDYGVSGVPETFVIVDGKIVKKFIGPISVYELEKVIDKLDQEERQQKNEQIKQN